MSNLNKIIKNEGSFDIQRDYLINRVLLREPAAEHTHQFIELVYTFSGRGVHTVDGREFPVKSGDLLLINYHCRHSLRPIENLSYMDIMLKPEYLSQTLKGTEDLFLLLQLQEFSAFSHQVKRENILLHFEGQNRERLEFLLNWTAEEQKVGLTARDLILHSALSMILSLVFRKMSQSQNIRLSINETLLQYMERNCHRKLPIREIADLCGYTPAHFSRIFKAYSGKTPQAYLTDARLSKAKELLSKTDKPIESIFALCGFSNRTSFYKKFTEATGSTPLQYRKNQKLVVF